MTTNFTIEPATEQDVPTILRMVRGLAEYEKLAHLVEATEARLRETLFGDRPHAEALIGYADSRPVGFAVFFHTYSTFLARAGLYLEDLFVEEASRRHGFGRMLLARVAAIAVARGCQRLEWAALDWNQPAIGFYRNLGARSMDEWVGFRLSGEGLTTLAAESPHREST